MKSGDFYKSIIESELSSQLLEFNFQPLNYIHSSWIESLFRKYDLNPSFESKSHHLQNIVLNEYELVDDYEFDFSDPVKKLFFLSSSILIKLTIWLGITMYADQIKRIIKREDRQNIVDLVGEDGMYFLMNQVPFLMSNWPDGYKKKIDLCKDDPCLAIKCAGFRVLATVVKGESLAFIKRIKLKLPFENRENFVPFENFGEKDQLKLTGLTFKIVKLGMPECMDLLR